MSDASWDLQSRILAILAAAPAIAGGKVYDNVPESVASAAAPDSAFPYVQIGETDAIPDDTSVSDDGEIETLSIHVWSRYRGQKEVKQIMQLVKQRLHGVELAVPNRTSAIAWVRIRRDFFDPDGRTRHGVVSVEVVHRN